MIFHLSACHCDRLVILINLCPLELHRQHRLLIIIFVNGGVSMSMIFIAVSQFPNLCLSHHLVNHPSISSRSFLSHHLLKLLGSRQPVARLHLAWCRHLWQEGMADVAQEKGLVGDELLQAWEDEVLGIRLHTALGPIPPGPVRPVKRKRAASPVKEQHVQYPSPVTPPSDDPSPVTPQRKMPIEGGPPPRLKQQQQELHRHQPVGPPPAHCLNAAAAASAAMQPRVIQPRVIPPTVIGAKAAKLEPPQPPRLQRPPFETCKFIPRPDDIAGLRLRAMKDKHNEREERRKARRRQEQELQLPGPQQLQQQQELLQQQQQVLLRQQQMQLHQQMLLLQAQQQQLHHMQQLKPGSSSGSSSLQEGPARISKCLEGPEPPWRRK